MLSMFSSALLDVLKNGDRSRPLQLSLRDIKELVEDRLARLPEQNAPRPGLYSPDQSEGDVADIPFFSNPCAKEEEQRKREEERIRQLEQEARAFQTKEERSSPTEISSHDYVSSSSDQFSPTLGVRAHPQQVSPLQASYPSVLPPRLSHGYTSHPSILVNFRGWALILSGAFKLIIILPLLLAAHISSNSTLFNFLVLFFTISTLFFLFGLPGLYKEQEKQVGWLGLVGMSMLFIAGIASATIGIGEAVLLYPLRGHFFINGYYVSFNWNLDSILFLFNIVGGIPWGIAVAKASVFPRWTGIFFAAGSAMNVLYLLVYGLEVGGLARGETAFIYYFTLSTLITLLLSISAIQWGYSLIRSQNVNDGFLSRD
jgi:DNA-binding transcriptional MerR regulator